MRTLTLRLFVVLATAHFCGTSARTEFIPSLECIASHNNGKISLPMYMNGEIFGGALLNPQSQRPCFPARDFFTPNLYPRDRPTQYILSGLPILAAVVDDDTIAYTSLATFDGTPNLTPDQYPFGDRIYRSSNLRDPDYSPDAISPLDFVSNLVDTLRVFSRDLVTLRHNKRLHARVTLESYSWPYEYAEDMVFFKYTARNEGKFTWESAYVGWYGQMGGRVPLVDSSGYDNFIGLMEHYAASGACPTVDTLFLVWSADDDGGPKDGQYVERPVFIPNRGWYSSPTAVGAVLPLVNDENLGQLSFNWYASDSTPPTFELYNPQRRENYNDYKTRSPFPGWPCGNFDGYHAMSNGERDIAQPYIGGLSPTDVTWTHDYGGIPKRIADGANTFGLISYGPLDVQPGASVEFSFAIVMGENFHTDPNHFANTMPHDPSAYLRGLNFSDLVTNATWARWIYDNPGIDTDGDGYFGKFRICVLDSVLTDSGWVASRADTTWYRGDGIPDWKAAGPPPAPYFTVTQLKNGLRIRFNGERSETEKDIFAQIVDFEGYRVYLGRDDREGSLNRIASFDRENYDKWVYAPEYNDSGVELASYEIRDTPFSGEQLRCLYGMGVDPCDDSLFDPLRYTPTYPYRHPLYPDSIMYFTAHDFNTDDLGVSTPITKVYPSARDPRPLTADQLDSSDYTPEGRFKFFEYELIVRDLLPTVPYWINVTAFDFGDPRSDLQPLESSPFVDLRTAYPAAGEDELTGEDLKVYVYPNPYRVDGDYLDEGYEGRENDLFPEDKLRRLNFANLPYECTIRVFTLDGDLVVEKEHTSDPSDPTGRHDYWSLINKNRQIVVSGMYYWTVEDKRGHVQMGTFVVLR